MQKILLLFLLLLTACEYRRLDTSSMAQERLNRQIKHVTASQMASIVDEWGKQIIEIINKKGASPTLLDSLEYRYGAKITLLQKLDTSFTDTKAQQVLEAYKYQQAKGLTMGDNVQKTKEGWLFTSPEKKSLWLIDFSKKDLILRIDPKQLKRLSTSN